MSLPLVPIPTMRTVYMALLAPKMEKKDQSTYFAGIGLRFSVSLRMDKLLWPGGRPSIRTFKWRDVGGIIMPRRGNDRVKLLYHPSVFFSFISTSRLASVQYSSRTRSSPSSTTFRNVSFQVSPIFSARSTRVL